MISKKGFQPLAEKNRTNSTTKEYWLLFRVINLSFGE
ncbi:MAG: hypothetical protein ACI8WB_003124 [Phenylobacterium sp.]|jgi:hypothetical protein